jgi:GNAT superfamily N-acetyltransferase
MNDPGSITVRPADTEDVEPMVGLLEQLFAIEADFTADPALQRRGLHRLLNKGEDACVLVAASTGQVVGMVTVQVLASTAEGGEVGLLEDLVVGDGWRGRGVGSALLAAAEAWSRCRGLARLQLLADRANGPGLEFYTARRWGETRLVCLRRRQWRST